MVLSCTEALNSYKDGNLHACGRRGSLPERVPVDCRARETVRTHANTMHFLAPTTSGSSVAKTTGSLCCLLPVRIGSWAGTCGHEHMRKIKRTSSQNCLMIDGFWYHREWYSCTFGWAGQDVKRTVIEWRESTRWTAAKCRGGWSPGSVPPKCMCQPCN